jgi:hypothetical protein
MFTNLFVNPFFYLINRWNCCKNTNHLYLLHFTLNLQSLNAFMINVYDGLFSEEAMLPILHHLHNRKDLFTIHGVVQYFS